jgi:hypothetical protein
MEDSLKIEDRLECSVDLEKLCVSLRSLCRFGEIDEDRLLSSKGERHLP